MRLEKKDLVLVIPATLLAIAGLGPDDPWVIGPCLFLSWLSFIVICLIHEGSRKWRVFIGVVITAAMVALAYRRLGAIFEGKQNSPHPLDLVRHIVRAFWIWLEGPHARWFDKLLGAIYVLLVIFVSLVITAAIKLARNQRTGGPKGFLDYKLDAETAMHRLPRIVEKLTNIMLEVKSAINKHTEALQKANSTAKQLRVSRRAALSLDKFSMQVDRVCRNFTKNGTMLSDGLIGWSTWVSAMRPLPSKTTFGTFPDLLKRFTETVNTTNTSLNGYISSASSVKGVSSVLNQAVDRHVASWNVVAQTNRRIGEACASALGVFNALP